MTDSKKTEKFSQLLQLLDESKHFVDEQYLSSIYELMLQQAVSSTKLNEALAVGIEILRELNMGQSTIVSGMLYVALSKEQINSNAVQQVISDDSKKQLRGLLKIPETRLDKLTIQADNFIQLLLTISEDIRSVLIKLVERLYMMRSLKTANQTTRQNTASEVYHLYAPIAHRLGLYKIKTELEELSMKYMHNEVYKDIAHKLAETKKTRDKYINDFINPLAEKLQKHNLKAEVKGRPKSIHSIWNKIKKQGVSFEEVYDLFAIRIIIDCPLDQEKDQCWKAYSLVTEKYKPNPRRLRDWISAPKSSGYESLHTTVIGLEGKWVEVQIRTRRMDEIAEKGPAAHWRYKGGSGNTDWLGKLREMLENPEKNIEQHDDVAKGSLYTDEIFIFTPEGDLKKLTRGGTVLDFAYSLHTALGSQCTGAIVNDKIVTIKHELQNGDTVKILSSKKQKPNYEWLKIAKSKRTISKIKRSLKNDLYKQAENGKEMLKQKLAQLKIPFDDLPLNKLLDAYNLQQAIDLYQQIGEGKIDLQSLKKTLVQTDETKTDAVAVPLTTKPAETPKKQSKNSSDFLLIDNDISTVDYHFAKCCNPIYGDPIFGFITVSKGTKIHKASCPNARDLTTRYPYRVVQAQWNTKNDGQQAFLANLKVVGKDKAGIISHITKLVSVDLKVNLASIHFGTPKDDIFEGAIGVYVLNVNQLNLVIKKLLAHPNIISVVRTDK